MALFCFTLAYGLGIHALCVALEEAVVLNLQEEEKENASLVLMPPTLARYVEFWHEIVSHNIFVSSFYLIMALMMKEERETAFSLSRAPETTTKKEAKLENTPSRCQISTPLPSPLLVWPWSVIVGAYLSIFAANTGTWLITCLFYAYTLLSAKKWRVTTERASAVPPVCVEQQRTDLVVNAVMKRAAFVGLPILLSINLSTGSWMKAII